MPAPPPPSAPERITMLLENNPYPQDIRVRAEAESLVRAGYAVEVVAPRAPGQAHREIVAGVGVRRFRARDAARPGVGAILAEYGIAALALHGAALRALLRGARTLHLHNPPDILFPAGALFRLAGRRVVFDHHDLGPELVAVKFGRPGLARLARVCEWLTFAVATDVLAANESHAELARTRGGKPAEAVTVVRNGPPAAWLERPDGRREGALRDVRLAYVGAIAPQDGVTGLAAILARLRARAGDLTFSLRVIGDGEEREALAAALAAAGMGENVEITGWVAPEAVPELLAEIDICLDPAPSSPLNERSTMMKVAEYLALGKPVVAYDLLETRRTLAGAGMLVPDGDIDAFAGAIERLAADGALRSALADRARERARRLTWEHSAAAMLAAYARRTPGAAAMAGPGLATGEGVS